MEKIDYKKVLLDIAVCAISCDGHIDQKEIDELNLIETNLNEKPSQDTILI